MKENINTKEQLRKSYRALRNDFSEEYIKSSSNYACELLVQTDEFKLAKTILLYYPIKNEISPLSIIEIAKSQGKSIAFPVCNNDSFTLTFKKVNDMLDLQKSTFGILEPKEHCEIVNIDEHTLCIVPAIAFSKDGHRLGYGKGYYDRFLENFPGKSIGFSYSKLLFDNLPKNQHDIPLDMIITESEVLYIAQKN